MNKELKRVLVGGALGVLAGGLSACGNAPAALDPNGPAAMQISWLSWILIGMGTVIYVGVCGFLLTALFRRRRAEQTGDDAIDQQENRTGLQIVLWGGMVMPILVLLVVAGLTLQSLMALATEPDPNEFVVEVIGHQWWWEVIYPDEQIVSANELHIPIGQPVRINLRAEGVVHSFWVPQLHGKLDMIPGHTNSFVIQADSTGEFRGICAEFCGIQHARMLFLVVAHEPADFDAWVIAEQKEAIDPESPTAQAGMTFFMKTPCVQCHAIAGTPAEGKLGPDLTHFASRREIGAGVMPNNRENLAAWLLNPQERKEGNLMPATLFSDDELEAMLDYLATLK